jgi:hypothetical protein
MKATKYIAALALLTGLISCQPEAFNGEIGKADTVEVTISVQFPEPLSVATKARMSDGPTADAFDIHLCLYGPGEGYVQNWIDATDVTFNEDPVTHFVTGGTFKALLPITNDRRTVHIIANPPASVNPTTSDYIDNVMEKMVTVKNTDDECSYWQQIILPNGIHAKEGTGSATQLPKADDNVTAAFNNVHLLRNFAKVVVTSPDTSDEDYEYFQVKRWTLINVPTMGYVAPYTGNKNNRFPSGYLNDFLKLNPTGPDLYAQLTGTNEGQDNYPGYMPPEATIDENFPGNPDTAAEGVYVNRGEPLFMYERPLPETGMTQTAVLIEVEFKDGHSLYREGQNNTYWYKIEVLDNHAAYVPFLRDIVYTLRIKGLPEIGETTAQAAFNGAYYGNISASLETAGLSDLSNGTSLIHVDRLDYTFLNGGVDIILTQEGTESGTPAQFYFKPNVAAANTYWQTTSGVCVINVEQKNVTGYNPAVTNVSVSSGGVITVTLAETGSAMKKSTIRVSGRVDDPNAKDLYRDITITLMDTQNFAHGSDVTCIENASTVNVIGVDNEVKFALYLPEGLGSSVFPVQVRIEAANNSLSAVTPDLPVKIGPSVFTPAKNTYFFIYTINYSDYCKLDPQTKKYEYTYDYHFTMYTSKRGDNTTTIDIRDLDGNFNPMTLTLQASTSNP